MAGPGRVELAAAMGASSVVMGLVLGQDCPQMPLSDNDEHRELVAVWKSLNGIMDGLRQRLRWGDTEYADVADMAD